MILIGIDIGVSPAPCGLAAYDVDVQLVLVTHTIRPDNPRGDVDERIASITQQINDTLGWLNVSALAYEAAHLQVNPQTALKLSRMCGAVIAIAALRGLPCYRVSPVEAKIALTGNQHAAKVDMIRAARQQFGLDVSSHEADAMGVALHAAGVWRRDQMMEAVEARNIYGQR